MKFDKKGLLGTVAVHIVLLIIFLIAAFKTPLPLPAEQGILINFGDVKYASGNTEPKPVKKEQPKPVETKPSPPVKTENNVATQNFEEAAAIETSPKKEEKKETKPVKKEEKKEQKEPEEKPREVNQRALYRGAKADAESNNSEGDATGSGNQGSPTGSPDSKNRVQGLSAGDGTSFSLAGRSPVKTMEPAGNFQEEGKVIVTITVDRNGNVVNAIPGAKGTTTPNQILWEASKKAALAWKFDQKSNAPFHQKGTITYYFKLR